MILDENNLFLKKYKTYKAYTACSIGELTLVDCGMMSCFLRSKSVEKTDDATFMIRNGRVLLEKLIASCNGKCNPICRFTIQELNAATNNYDIENIVTSDLLYKLYKGILRDRPISVMKFDQNKRDVDGYSFTGIVFSSQMIHKNILRLLGCCLDTQIPILVYESVEYGTLANRIFGGAHHPKFEPLSLTHRLKIAMEIANAVSYLHAGFPRPVVFRDIKPSTILFHEKYVAKLFDFSLSVCIPEGETHINDNDKVIGTFGFVAPEYLKTGYCNEKCDVYSFGAFLLELLTGQRINQDLGVETVDNEYFLGDRVKKYVEHNKLNEIVDPVMFGNGKEKQLQAFAETALECLSVSAEDRPTMIQVTKLLRRIYQSLEFQTALR